MGGESGQLAQSLRSQNFGSMNSAPSIPASPGTIPAAAPIRSQSPSLLLSGMMEGRKPAPGAYIGGLPANTVLGGSYFAPTTDWERFRAEIEQPMVAPQQPAPQQMQVAPVPQPAPAPMRQPTPVRPTRKRTISDESE